MTPAQQALLAFRGQTFAVILGTVFLFVGLAALALAIVRRRHHVGLLIWFGVFSGLYGLRLLAETGLGFALLPISWWDARPFVIAIITYLIFIPALLFWLELSIGNFRRVIRVAVGAAITFAVVAIGVVLVTHNPFALFSANGVFAIVMMLLLGVVNAVPAWARKCLSDPSPVLAAGSIVLAVVALVNNILPFVVSGRLPNLGGIEALAFGVFVFSLAYVAAQRMTSTERKLVEIESELAIAREIQQSILPTSVPQLKQLRVAASYLPMAAVAGDFYEFIDIDDKHAGFLVADVSGHGVPAALIASMLKVAMHSAAEHASAPADLMSELNRVLSQELRGQFVTAAYLYVDLQERRAMYSAAGHPPLMHWNARSASLEKIESNGLLFGVLKETPYPAHELRFNVGDRFLLYTDGLVEAENQGGEAFGQRRLLQLVSANASLPASGLTALLLKELAAWQGSSGVQQDDVTLIIVDVL